jgi:hypothetical protein
VRLATTLAATLASQAELNAVGFILQKEWPDGTSDEDVAEAAIKALDKVRSTTWRPIGPPLHLRQAFKSIRTAETHYVVWIGEYDGKEYAWIVTEKSEYGWFSLSSSPFWLWTEPVPEKKGTNRTVKTPVMDATGNQVLDEDGEPVFTSEKKFYPPVHERIFVNEIGMVVGDRIKLRQYNRFEILAVHANGVLMKDRDSGQICPETNANIQKYYQDGWS